MSGGRKLPPTMAPAPAAIIDLPSSYASLGTTQIRVSHVPASSPTPTPVVLVTLDRPKNYNSFTKVMEEELIQVFSMFDVDDRVKSVVLHGAGKMFCAGADLDIGFVAQKESARQAEHRDGGGRVSLAIHNCSKPTIAAINGAAVGVGITMCLPAAIRVAYQGAKIGFVFAKRGIIMEACSSYFLPRLIGTSRAIHLTTTGAVIPASSPLLSNLFSELLPTPEATLARALELADDVAKNTSVVSTKLMRDLIYRGADSAEGAHLLDSKVIFGLFGGKDNDEGVKSFFEKRPAKFVGKMPDDAPTAYPWWEPVNIASSATAKKPASKL